MVAQTIDGDVVVRWGLFFAHTETHGGGDVVVDRYETWHPVWGRGPDVHVERCDSFVRAECVYYLAVAAGPRRVFDTIGQLIEGLGVRARERR